MYEVSRILFPTDFSPRSGDAFEHALLLAERFHAHLDILHVDESAVGPLGSDPGCTGKLEAFHTAIDAYCEEQFAGLRARAEERRLAVSTRIERGRAYKVIVEESEKEICDMIVIAHQGWTGLSAHLLGSTAERVVRLSRQPVLSVRQRPHKEERPSSVLCPTDLSPAANVSLSYAVSVARRYDATLYIQYISEIDKPETEADIRKRLPDLREVHPLADEVKVQWLFDRDVDPSNSIIRFAEDRDVDLIVMSVHGRKGIRRVYIGNTTAEVVRQSTRPVLTVTHPLHKQIFSHPLTERITIPPFLDDDDREQQDD